MPNSKAHFITASARRDLEQIAEYTQRTWGVAQKKKYLSVLKGAVQALCGNPEMGMAREDVLPGLRAITIAKHIIFYRIGEDNAVNVIRILHHAMDPAQQIDKTNP